jgi:hypothetical protein
MTQRPIVDYLSLKGMSAREIHDDIIVTLGPDAVSYSSVTRYLREARFPPSKPEPHPADVQRDLDDSDQAILAALEDGPFASVRQLSRLTHVPSKTVCRSLTQSLEFVARHLRWVPHALSDPQKARESICPGNYCECSKSSAIEHGMTSLPSTSLDFTGVQKMNSSCYHEMKSSRKRTTRNSIEKIHSHDRLESARVPFDHGPRKGRKFNACFYIAETLKPLSQ